MSSIRRPLAGDILVFHLDDETEKTRNLDILARSGRSARTLFKQGTLRATLVILDAGGELEEHSAPGPISVQPLQGRIRFSASGESHELGVGDILTAGPGVRHSVSSEEGSTFLLTVSHPEPSDE